MASNGGAQDPKAQLFNLEYNQETSELNFPVPPLVLEGFCAHSTIAGSVNGLLLVQNKYKKLFDGDYILWNPSIRKCIRIPLPPAQLPLYTNFFLGFDPSTDDYKVVSITLHFKHQEPTPGSIDIFSLNSCSWRNVNCSGEVCHLAVTSTKKVYLGGCVYWIGYGQTYDDSEDSYGLVSFNMTSETFSYTPLPDNDSGTIKRLELVDGLFVGLLIWSDVGCVDIWELERDRCWIKRHSLDISGCPSCQLSCYVKKDGVIVLGLFEGDSQTVFACDTSTGNRSVVSESRRRAFYIGPYIESLRLL